METYVKTIFMIIFAFFVLMNLYWIYFSKVIFTNIPKATSKLYSSLQPRFQYIQY